MMEYFYVNYFHKKAPSWMFDWVLNMPLKEGKIAVIKESSQKA